MKESIDIWSLYIDLFLEFSFIKSFLLRQKSP